LDYTEDARRVEEKIEQCDSSILRPGESHTLETAPPFHLCQPSIAVATRNNSGGSSIRAACVLKRTRKVPEGTCEES
jgi:hypothetical protein